MYKTTEEKSAQWGVTSKTIQNLCRQGKIQGAVKRAGAWFIPDDAPNPTKNTKSGAEYHAFVGTKKKIFESSIQLFMLSGFESVTIKDIADDVGIAQSAIYNHFNTKQEILDIIYAYYCNYYTIDRPRLEDLETVLQDGTNLDIIRSVRYSFSEEYQLKLINITKIIFQRISTDKRAQEIFNSLIIGEGIAYVEAVFNRAIEIGRFTPFDTRAIAVFINSISLYTLYCWIADPLHENTKKVMDDEQEQYKHAAEYLTKYGI